MSKLWPSVVSLIYEIGDYSGCHQMPERSFFYKGRQFPVCARCTGVFIGQLAAVVCNIFTDISVKISVLFLGIMGVDWSIQEAGIKESTNTRRFLTGILGGFGLYNFYCVVIKRLVRRHGLNNQNTKRR